jgi:hypothetical protein
MRNGKEYLLRLDTPAGADAAEGSIATIYDWPAGNSFTVIAVAFSQSDWASSAHVRATSDNSYGALNFGGSRLRYRKTDGTSDSRQITAITDL